MYRRSPYSSLSAPFLSSLSPLLQLVPPFHTTLTPQLWPARRELNVSYSTFLQLRFCWGLWVLYRHWPSSWITMVSDSFSHLSFALYTCGNSLLSHLNFPSFVTIVPVPCASYSVQSLRKKRLFSGQGRTESIGSLLQSRRGVIVVGEGNGLKHLKEIWSNGFKIIYFQRMRSCEMHSNWESKRNWDWSRSSSEMVCFPSFYYLFNLYSWMFFPDYHKKKSQHCLCRECEIYVVLIKERGWFSFRLGIDITLDHSKVESPGLIPLRKHFEITPC